MEWIIMRAKVALIAVNMMICWFLFWLVCLPRETLSGLAGRYATQGVALARIAEWAIDLIFWFDPDHCRTVSAQERVARESMGYHV